MASPITHFIVGAALATPAVNSAPLRRLLPPWAIAVIPGLYAVLPDVDILWFRHFPFDSAWGHRGFTHAPFTLILAASLIALLWAGTVHRPAPQFAFLLAAAAVTHPLLDMLTDGGFGVMALFPFSPARLFFAWRPIHVSPLNALRFFSGAGYILKSELPIALAAVTFAVAAYWTQLPARPTSGTTVRND